MPVKVGDKVYYKSYSTDEIEENGEKYIVVSLDNIIAIAE